MAGSAELRCCPRCSGRRESGAQSFGVRSYLHLFYEDCTFIVPRDAEEDPRNKGDPVPSWSWYSIIWKVSFVTGLLLVLTGGVSLSAGLLLPPRIEGFGEGELLMVDVRAAGHNGMLRACRLAGALLLGAGAAALLACALASPVRRAGERLRDDGDDDAAPSSGAWTPVAVSPILLPLPVGPGEAVGVQPRPSL